MLVAARTLGVGLTMCLVAWVLGLRWTLWVGGWPEEAWMERAIRATLKGSVWLAVVAAAVGAIAAVLVLVTG